MGKPHNFSLAAHRPPTGESQNRPCSCQAPCLPFPQVSPRFERRNWPDSILRCSVDAVIRHSTVLVTRKKPGLLLVFSPVASRVYHRISSRLMRKRKSLARLCPEIGWRRNVVVEHNRRVFPCDLLRSFPWQILLLFRLAFGNWPCAAR